MIACDVNILVSAHNTSDPRHDDFRDWLEPALVGATPVALASLVLSAFVRLITHPRILAKPLSPATALDAASALRTAPAAVELVPGPRHWAIFDDLCRRVEARGNVVPDAYLAALAIESGSTWVTADRGFARFPGLTTRHPLD